MNVALRKTWTIEQFLEWEERQELKHEFNGYQPEARIGGTAAHEIIKMNLAAALSAGCAANLAGRTAPT